MTSIGGQAFWGCSNLVSAIFAGDAPTLGTNVFANTASGFTIYYLTGSTAFTSPTWEGYPAIMLDEMPSASGIWLLSHGLPLDTDLTQDHNGDGVTLLTSYALNLDPSNPLPGMPVAVLSPGTLSMSYYGTAQGVSCEAETSTDLQTWTTDGVTVSDPDVATCVKRGDSLPWKSPENNGVLVPRTLRRAFWPCNPRDRFKRYLHVLRAICEAISGPPAGSPG